MINLPEVIRGVHAGHVESQFHHIRRGDVSERNQFVLVDGAQAVPGHPRDVGPGLFEKTQGRRRVARTFQTVGILAHPCLAVAVFYHHFGEGDLYPLVIVRLESVGATEKKTKNFSGEGFVTN